MIIEGYITTCPATTDISSTLKFCSRCLYFLSKFATLLRFKKILVFFAKKINFGGQKTFVKSINILYAFYFCHFFRFGKKSSFFYNKPFVRTYSGWPKNFGQSIIPSQKPRNCFSFPEKVDLKNFVGTKCSWNFTTGFFGPGFFGQFCYLQTVKLAKEHVNTFENLAKQWKMGYLK